MVCVEVRKRGDRLTDNMYLNSYLTSINCVRGKEHKHIPLLRRLLTFIDSRDINNSM